MMYTSPKFESEEAAKSQVERLQNQQQPMFGCHGGQLPPVHGAEPGRQHELTDITTSTGGAIAIVQSMQISKSCNSQSNALHQPRNV